jgi:hypothetical protein
MLILEGQNLCGHCYTMRASETCFGYDEEPLIHLVCRCCVSAQLSAGFLELFFDHACMLFRTGLDRAFEWQGARVEPVREGKTIIHRSSVTISQDWETTVPPLTTYMSTSTSSPLTFRAGLTSNAHNIRAILMATEADPRCRPGQIRRPQPNALCPRLPGYSRAPRKRSG